MENNREYYMKQALKEAEKAYKKLEVPVGAVIVKNGEIIDNGTYKKLQKTSEYFQELSLKKK